MIFLADIRKREVDTGASGSSSKTASWQSLLRRNKSERELAKRRLLLRQLLELLFPD